MTTAKTKCHGRECKGKKTNQRYMPLVTMIIDQKVPIKKAAKLLDIDLKLANQMMQQAKAKEPELYHQAMQFNL